MAAKEDMPASVMSESIKHEEEAKQKEAGEKQDEEGESDEEDDVEPQLKYERIGNDLANILNKDAASCMAVHPKFLALGTHWGMIHILDHIGHNIRSKELPAHTTTVNQISIDDNGDYIASCSDDGRVVINGLYDVENNQTINFDRPIRAVALDPTFSKSGSGKQFVTGEDKLVLNEKGFLSRYKMYTLHQGEGPIRNIQWKSSFIAWSNDQGVKIYDMNSKKRITFIAKDTPRWLAPEMYRCSLCWKDDKTLLIGWGDKIKVCLIREREQIELRDLPDKYVEIIYMFTVEFMICGIAPHGDQLVILTYDEAACEQERGQMVAARPQLRIIEPHMHYYDEVTNDALSIRGFQRYKCNDYHLECLKEENTFFIVSPKDIVIARPRDKDDHVMWLLEHDKYEEAMAVALDHGKELKRHNYQKIGLLYIDYLLERGEFTQAAQLCVKILGKKKDLWEQQVWKFHQIHQLKVLAPYLPTGEPSLSPQLYEMMLHEFLQTDHQGFQHLIKGWPSISIISRRYTYEKHFDKALYIFLKLRHPEVFDLIHRHNLFDSISDQIVLLMEFDVEAAIKMLLDNTDRIPVAKVVKQLEHKPELLHLYLDHLFIKDPELGRDFHNLQVRLYAEFDRVKLLPFLRNSTNYPLQEALHECQQRNLIPEMVFLLGRMGNTKQALDLIVNELRDVSQAIDFCKEQNDEELWEDLIDYSLDKPSFITGLLNNIGTHVDPRLLILKIREGMEIKGLRDSLVKILQDYNLQTSLQEGCRKILVNDGFSLMQKLIKMQRKGIRVDGN
ncbi:hypothetical protein LSH36_606g03004 [Paralvinella palmiformis]|uniref:Vacuolar protein sorting-associated protein 41 homolog n=1 Tax=Paralvinella palmiformis TaxID=53620 RepID=A0AAD9J4X0_9ANNE|nr:hypothetical protein LSH36_606g03004 [Paralvinella palmiformis]